MNFKKFRWVKLAENISEISFADNGITELQVEERRICMAFFNGRLFAFTSLCPHASGRFKDGHLDPFGNIVCPLHRFKYNLDNGQNISGEGYYLKRWPVEVRVDGIYVGFENNKLFGLI
ncbi:MAG: hypothetical protein NVS1B13_06500 [Flavisolibacter sp.]